MASMQQYWKGQGAVDLSRAVQELRALGTSISNRQCSRRLGAERDSARRCREAVVQQHVKQDCSPH